ncbi:uncharacterized protein TNCV_140751 [Trichonephila clavipes]|nr:uncharacterized protein TNCV_140751 [Trichonephila clavipes]
MDFSHHIKPLTGEIDWLMWKRKIRDLLDYQRRSDEVIDGKLKKPESIDADAQESIMDKETAFEAWESLRKQFEATQKISCLNLHRVFLFSWVPGEDISTHIAKLRSLWNELNNGLEAREESKLPDFASL